MQGFIQDFVLGEVRGKCVGGGHICFQAHKIVKYSTYTAMAGFQNLGKCHHVGG